MRKYHYSILVILAVLSFLDMVLTLIEVNGGVATEANPILLYALNQSVIYFCLTKILLTGIGIYILHRLEFSKFGRICSIICLIIYLPVMLVHCKGMYLLL